MKHLFQTKNKSEIFFSIFQFIVLNQVSATIKKLRESKGLNKSQAAERLGISSQLLGQYETGKRLPKMQFLLTWKKVFGEDLMKQKEAFVSNSEKLKVEDPQLLQAIVSIAESNKSLSESNKVLAESNRGLVESNKELVILAKEAFHLNLNKLQKADQQPIDPEIKFPPAKTEKLPLRSRLAGKSSSEAMDKQST